jgi:hypothetical protein
VSLAPPPLLEGISAIAAVALAASAARSLAASLLPQATSSLRLTGAGVLWVALLVAGFRLLAAVSLFGAVPALVLFAIVAWLSGRRGVRPLLETGVRPLFATRWALALVPGAAVLLASTLRGLAAPPLGWDALTYHLFRAGRWVRDGRLGVQGAPDAWGYYEWFPRTGDSLWSWALLGLRDGGLLAAAGLVVLAGVALAAYALARALGATREGALLAGGAVALIPAAANALTVAYVDNTVLALTLAGTALAIEAIRTRGAGSTILAGLALGLACATKYSMLQPLAGAVLVIAWAAGVRTATLFTGASALPLALECAGRWLVAGSPVWPFRLALLGREIFPGNEELVALLQGKLALPGQAVVDVSSFFRWLFGPGRHEFAQTLGVGPIVPLLGAIAIVALVRAQRKPAALAVAVAVLTVTATLGEDNLALRTLWAQTYARFTLPAFAIAIVAASSIDAWWGRAALAFHALVGAALAWPHGWCEADVGGALRALVPFGAGIGLALLAMRVTRSARLSLLVAALPALVLLPGIRADLRYRIYEAASRPRPAFDMHELNRDYAGAWPIWRALDDGAPHRVAVAAGWDGTGHNTYLFPLLGSRLQNEVVYVPPTRDGRAIDYRRGEELSAAASHEAWMGRLVAERVDTFAALAPPPPERTAWIARDPGRFAPLAASASGESAAWSVYPPGASRPPR